VTQQRGLREGVRNSFHAGQARYKQGGRPTGRGPQKAVVGQNKVHRGYQTHAVVGLHFEGLRVKGIRAIRKAWCRGNEGCGSRKAKILKGRQAPPEHSLRQTQSKRGVRGGRSSEGRNFISGKVAGKVGCGGIRTEVSVEKPITLLGCELKSATKGGQSGVTGEEASRAAVLATEPSLIRKVTSRTLPGSRGGAGTRRDYCGKKWLHGCREAQTEQQARNFRQHKGGLQGFTR